jgi:hypothetical protein
VKRAELDQKVKGLLVHPAQKFTEWLIQQGLVRSASPGWGKGGVENFFISQIFSV